MTPGRRVTGVCWWACSLALVGTLLACPGEIREQPVDVASLSLACRPASHGVECRLLALLRDATGPPRDVTTRASWHVGGAAEIHLSRLGVIHATGNGDVAIDTDYQSKTARVMVRLTPGHPAQLLATVRGAVYVSDRGRLTPLVNARVEVVGGPGAGNQTTTGGDGTYELPAVVPGDIVIRATRNGFEPAVLSAQIQPGDNRISLVVTAEPAIKVLA
jgi:Carboxypeptidase regulatory-like domain